MGGGSCAQYAMQIEMPRYVSVVFLYLCIFVFLYGMLLISPDRWYCMGVSVCAAPSFDTSALRTL